MKILTFLPLEEIEKYAKLEGGELNRAKETLAFEGHQADHGEEEAVKAQDAARALFGSGVSADNMPSASVPASLFEGR